jgi:hypothetical protein
MVTATGMASVDVMGNMMVYFVKSVHAKMAEHA